MNEQYDSVLKEKKKYKEVVDDRVFLRKHSFLLNFLVVLVILIVSFIIYFFTVLSPVNIILGDIEDFINFTSIIYKNIEIDYDFNDKYNFYGDVSIETDSNYDNIDDINFLKQLDFNYSYMSDSSRRLLNINSDDYGYTYYEEENQVYFHNSNWNVFYSSINNSFMDISVFKTDTSILEHLDMKLKTVTYKKNVFVDEGKLVVSVNFKLSGRELKELFDDYSFNLIDDFLNESANYEFTIKNDIFKNDLISLKMVVRDQDYRGVLTYGDNSFEYKDDTNNYRGVLKVEQDDFSFRFYEGENMKFIVTGKGSDSSYVYTYQVIQVVDKISLQIKKDDLENVYTINIKKENGDKYLNILSTVTLKYNNIPAFDNLDFLNQDYKQYSELSDAMKKQVDDYITLVYDSLNRLFQYAK